MGGFYAGPRQNIAYNGLNPGQRRDTRRQRLYAAEMVLRDLRVSTAAKRHLTDSVRGQGFTYPHIESAQDYVDAICASAWFRRRWGLRHFDVRHSHGGSSHAGYGPISMSTAHRRSEAVILHEMAHNLTYGEDSCAAWHGPEFAGVLLTLVKYAMGSEHAATLRASYKRHGVRYTMDCVPSPDEGRRRQADKRGPKAPTKTRHKPVGASGRKPPKRIETVEEMEEVGRKAALRGSDWDRAENAAMARASGDLRYDGGRRAFSRGFGAVRDAVNRGEIDDPMR